VLLYRHEQERSTGNTGQTAIDRPRTARFNRFYGETPIKLFNWTTFQKFTQAPWQAVGVPRHVGHSS